MSMGGEYMEMAAKDILGVNYDERVAKADRIFKTFQNFLHPGICIKILLVGWFVVFLNIAFVIIRRNLY